MAEYGFYIYTNHDSNDLILTFDFSLMILIENNCIENETFDTIKPNLALIKKEYQTNIDKTSFPIKKLIKYMLTLFQNLFDWISEFKREYIVFNLFGDDDVYYILNHLAPFRYSFSGSRIYSNLHIVLYFLQSQKKKMLF